MSLKIKNKLKHYTSFVVDQLIEEQHSKHSGILQVHLSRGKIKLSTKNATYSYEEYYTVFERGFQQLQLPKEQLKNALILGFGLGSVPILLEKVYDMQLQYTGIEIDPAVINLAQKYLDKNILNRVQLIEADAYQWISEFSSNSPYDLLVVDLFIDHITQARFFDLPFLKKTAQCLSQNGYLLFNTLSYKNNKKQLNVYFNEIFKKVFPKGKRLKIGLNHLLVGKI